MRERQIKFRAWDTADKCYKSSRTIQDICAIAVSDLVVKDYEFEQYTELKDKNGVEIYEGDILDSNPEEYPEDTPCPYIVIYDDGSYKGKRVNGEFCNALSLSTSRLKVCSDIILGNIHENISLLKT